MNIMDDNAVIDTVDNGFKVSLRGLEIIISPAIQDNSFCGMIAHQVQ